MILVKFIFRLICGILCFPDHKKYSAKYICLIHSFHKNNQPTEHYYDILKGYTSEEIFNIYIDRRTLFTFFFRKSNDNSIKYVEHFLHELFAMIYHLSQCYISKLGLRHALNIGEYDDNRLIYLISRKIRMSQVEAIVTPAEFLQWELKLNKIIKKHNKKHLAIGYSEYSVNMLKNRPKIDYTEILTGSKRSYTMIKNLVPDTRSRLIQTETANRTIVLNKFENILFAAQSEFSQNCILIDAIQKIQLLDKSSNIKVTLSLHPLTKRSLVNFYQEILNDITVVVGMTKIDMTEFDALIFSNSTSWHLCSLSACVPLRLVSNKCDGDPIPKITMNDFEKLINLKPNVASTSSSEFQINSNEIYWN